MLAPDVRPTCGRAIPARRTAISLGNGPGFTPGRGGSSSSRSHAVWVVSVACTVGPRLRPLSFACADCGSLSGRYARFRGSLLARGAPSCPPEVYPAGCGCTGDACAVLRLMLLGAHQCVPRGRLRDRVRIVQRCVAYRSRSECSAWGITNKCPYGAGEPRGTSGTSSRALFFTCNGIWLTRHKREPPNVTHVFSNECTRQAPHVWSPSAHPWGGKDRAHVGSTQGAQVPSTTSSELHVGFKRVRHSYDVLCTYHTEHAGVSGAV